jgi:hypothetical protein
MSDRPPESLSQTGVKEPKPLTTKPFTYKMPRYLQYALRVEAAVLIASLAAYLLLQYFGATYRFDKNSAADFVKTTESVLKNHKSITVKGFDSVRSEMAKALSVNNYQTVRIEYFFPDSDKSTFTNTLDTAAVGKLIKGIKLVPETAFHQKYSLVSSIRSKTPDDLFTKFNLNQFISTNGFWNNLEDDPLKYFCLVVAVILLVTMSIAYYDLQRQHRRYDRAIQFQRAYNASADVSESWITAQTMLDAYHQRNLNQNNWTFRLSVIVMAIGCVIIFYGIQKAIGLNAHAAGVKGVNDGTSLIAILSTASGIIVNLIGGTFLAIYNSTLKQAIDYTNSLQKTSTVGTSLAILKSIEVAQQQAGTPDPVTMAKLIDAKIAIAQQLIGVSGP